MNLRIAAQIGFTAALACAAIAQGLDPQEARLTAAPYFPAPAVTFGTEKQLVEVEVVVRDRQGHPVGGLTKSDFQIRDGGKPRAISDFSVQKRLALAVGVAARAPAAASDAPTPAPPVQAQPRWVGIVFDDFDLPPADLFNAKAAAKRFLKDGLSANDRVSVITTARGTVAPFTADVAKISEGIDKVSLQERKVRSGSCPLIEPYEAYLIANNMDSAALDVKALEYASCSGACGQSYPASRGNRTPPVCDLAIGYVRRTASQLWEQIRQHSEDTLWALRNIVDSMARMEGARMILFASSGYLNGTLYFDEDQLVNKALRANVVINSLDAKGLYTIDAPVDDQTRVESAQYRQILGTRPKDALNDSMGNLADSTGGLYLHNSNDLDLGFRELGMQPEVSYLLGFAPGTLDNKYHPLKVSLTAARHATVQARQGYVAASQKAEPQKPRVDRRIDRELFTTTLLDEAPVMVTISPEKTAEGASIARLNFHVDIGKAHFLNQDGTRAQTFHMIAALLDAQGAFVIGVEAVLDLSLKEATYQRELTSGFNAYLKLEAPAGSYRLRTVVVEGGEGGRYSTATQTAEID